MSALKKNLHSGNERLERFREKTSADTIGRDVNSVNAFEEMLMRLMRGETLLEICAAWDVPHDRVLCWLISDDRRYAIYLRALSESELRPENVL